MLTKLAATTVRLIDRITRSADVVGRLTPLVLLAALGMGVLAPAPARAQSVERASDSARALAALSGGNGGSANGETEPGVPGTADFNGDGSADPQDFFDFLAAYFAGAPAADFNRDNSVNPQDVLDFLAEGDDRTGRVGPDWMRPLPGQWCVTQEWYTAGLIDQGIDPLAVVCAPDGLCDNPADRDAAIPTVETPIKTYRLSIHVFCDDNGGNCAATQADVETAVGRLNADYTPWRIQFLYQTNFINSTRYRALDNSEVYRMKRLYADSPATKLNIYVVTTSSGGSWGTFPWDPNSLGAQGGIVMDDTWFVAGTAIPSVLTHEVGHCLGLWHTHHGVSEVPQCGDCYEAAGRPPEDGDIAGDRCSDTNPSPTNANNCFDPPEPDPCSGNPWTMTPYLNYMSYSHRCPVEFTPHQAGRMHCWTADRLGGWLQLPMPPAAPGTPTLTRIGGGQVRVAWADNSNNEDGFRVQREKKQGGSWINPQIVATVGANTTSATDAPGTGTFRYRVQGFNGNGDSAWSGWRQVNN